MMRLPRVYDEVPCTACIAQLSSLPLAGQAATVVRGASLGTTSAASASSTAAHVFGIAGDAINSIIEALRKRHDRIRFVPVRHEEAAAFMASAFAKHTGRLGVGVGTTGPGAPFTC